MLTKIYIKIFKIRKTWTKVNDSLNTLPCSDGISGLLLQKNYSKQVHMNKLSFILGLFLVMLGTAVSAQKATLKGSVVEIVDGKEQPVPFANVALIEKLQGTTTDFDGNYVISGIDAGTHTLVISFIGFKPDTQKVTLSPGQEMVKKVTLGQNSEMLNEFKVEAKKNRESVNVLLMDQKNASEIKQTIGAQELSKKGASDVATGLSKVTGVTIVAGRDIFVRGLGDRYNMATFNGGAIASPNPDLKVIPLSIFPTDVVQSISIDKVFVPRYFADYAGAKIDIISKDYPEDPFFKIELGTSFNSITTFKDFATRKDGDINYLGFDGKGRDMPAIIKQNARNNSYASADVEDKSNPYENGTNNQIIKAAPSTSIALSGGNFYDVGEHSGIGFFVAGTQDNSYQNKTGLNRVLKADRAAITDYEQTESVYSTNSMLYGNLYYKINDNNKVSLNLLYINSSETPTSINDGFNNDQGASLLTSRNTFFQDKMRSTQLVGKHVLAEREKWVLNWNASNSSANNQEKDRKQLVWLVQDDNTYSINALDLAANHRFWSDLNEKQNNASVELEHKFKYLSDTKDDSNQGRVYFGYNYLKKKRDFDWRQINYEIDNPPVANNPLVGVWDVNNPEALLNEENLINGFYRLKEQKDPSSTYFATNTIHAGYANADYYLVPDKFQVQVGVRLEMSSQEIRYKKLSDLFSGAYRTNSIDTINIFPVIGAKYVINEKSNLRFSGSQTVTRPLFREIAPFQYLPYFGGVQEEGNVNLKNAYNYNVDLKYEWFPNLGEMVAVTVFGKYLDSPIERVQVASATPLATYINTDKAYAAGLEFEVTKNLGNLIKADSGWTKNVFVGFNASYLYTQISIDTSNNSKGAIVVTNPKRSLQGASPILVNADVTYRANFKKLNTVSDFTLTYNVFGKRIYSAGVQGLPDVYEMPVNTVDFIWKNKIGDRFSVDFTVRNILNPTVKYQQEFTDITEIVRDYKRGVTYGVKLGYSF